MNFVLFLLGHTTQLVGCRFPDQGSNLRPLLWRHGVSTTGQPEEPLPVNFFFFPLCVCSRQVAAPNLCLPTSGSHTEIEKSLAICKEFEFVVWKVTTIKRNTFPIQKNKNTKGKRFFRFSPCVCKKVNPQHVRVKMWGMHERAAIAKAVLPV